MPHLMRVTCRCGRSVKIPTPEPWMPADELLQRLRCTDCGQRPVDLRVNGIDDPSEAYSYPAHLPTPRAPADIVPIAHARRKRPPRWRG